MGKAIKLKKIRKYVNREAENYKKELNALPFIPRAVTAFKLMAGVL